MKRRKQPKLAKQTPPPTEASSSGELSSVKVLRRPFPGPSGQKVALRVAVEREAYAEITAHAKESLDQEVCGILAGEFCEDDEGPFVHVQAAIRGAATKAGGAHVTFTQETWNQIHSTLEKQYPKLQIVGWYHSHPGFGVAFSDMDRFIHENFFPLPTHLALLTDPLGGEVALAINGPDGLEYLDRFWVDAREQKAQVPSPPSGSSDASERTTSGDWPAQLEQRLGQLIQTVDELRALHSRFLMALFLVACLTAVISIGYQIYTKFAQAYQPPERLTTVPVPIQIGDKTVMLLIGVDGWAVPPEITAAYIQMEKERQQKLQEAAKQAQDKQSKGQSASSPQATSSSPTPSPKLPSPGSAQTNPALMQPPAALPSPQQGPPPSSGQQPSTQKAPSQPSGQPSAPQNQPGQTPAQPSSPAKTEKLAPEVPTQKTSPEKVDKAPPPSPAPQPPPQQPAPTKTDKPLPPSPAQTDKPPLPESTEVHLENVAGAQWGNRENGRFYRLLWATKST